MPTPLLTFLKYIFLALLYLFFLRVLRAVWIELREPKVVGSEPAEPSLFDTAFASPLPPVTGAGATRGAGATGPIEDGALTAFSPIIADHHLVVTSPPGRLGVAYPLDGEVTVGRSPGCSISLPDDTFVSQVHARVFRRDGEWWVEDLGSTNGTYLNDTPVTSPVVVRSGDRVQFGQTITELRP